MSRELDRDVVDFFFIESQGFSGLGEGCHVLFALSFWILSKGKSSFTKSLRYPEKNQEKILKRYSYHLLLIAAPSSNDRSR